MIGLSVYGETVTRFRYTNGGFRVIETAIGIATKPDGSLKTEEEFYEGRNKVLPSSP